MSEDIGIGAKVQLDMSQFSGSISKINEGMKLIQAQFKEASTRLGAYASESDKLSVRQQELTAKISQQQKAVETLNAAYQKSVEENGKDSEETNILAKSLLNAQSTLNKMNNDLQKTSKELEETESPFTRLKTSVSNLEEQSKKSTSAISSAFGNLKSTLMGMVGTVVAGLSIKAIIDDTDEAEKNLAQMDAVLKSTGDASGMTKDKLIELAEAQSKVTTYSAETTEKAENLMLTFTKVGKDVFPSAVVAAEDMATALHTDVNSATMQLGKALGNLSLSSKGTVQGLTALKKSGVNFSDEEQKQIATMLKHNDVAGAQKVVIQELSKEFGGSATAAAQTLTGQVQVMTNNIRDSGIKIVSAIMPIATNLMPSITKGAQGMASAVTAHKAQIVGAVQEAANIIKTAFSFVETHGALIKGLLIGLAGTIGTVKVAVMASNAVQAVSNALAVSAKIASGGLEGGEKALAAAKGNTTLATMVQSAAVVKHAAVTAAGTIATNAHAVAQRLLNAAFRDNSIGIVITLIAALIAALVVLYNKNSTFRNFVNGMWAEIKNTVGTVVKAIVGFFTVTIPQAWNNFIAFMRTWGPMILALTVPVLGIPLLIFQHWSQVQAFFQNLWNSIVSFFTNAIPAFIAAVGQWFQQLPYNIGYALGTAVADVINFGASVWNWVTGTLPGIIQGIIQWFQQLPGMIWNYLVQVVTNISTWGSNMWTYLSEEIPKIINAIGTWFSQLPGRVWTWLLNTITNIRTWGTNMYTAATTAVTNTINAVVNWFQQLPGRIWNFLVTIVTNAGTWGSNLHQTVSNAVQTVINGVITWFGKLPGEMLDIGSNIVKGIWDGISSAAGWLYNQIAGFCKGIVDGIKSHLKIHSPSQVMADEVGKFMALGIGQGFSDNMQTVMNKMTAAVSNIPKMRIGVSAQMKPALAGAYATPTAADSVKAALKGGDVTIQNIYQLKTPSASEITRLQRNDLRRLGQGFTF